MCKMKSTDHLPLEKAIRYIGKLGGHNGRKGDGVPGMVSLWRGWIKLEGQAELFEDIKSQLQF